MNMLRRLFSRSHTDTGSQLIAQPLDELLERQWFGSLCQTGPQQSLPTAPLGGSGPQTSCSSLWHAEPAADTATPCFSVQQLTPAQDSLHYTAAAVTPANSTPAATATPGEHLERNSSRPANESNTPSQHDASPAWGRKPPAKRVTSFPLPKSGLAAYFKAVLNKGGGAEGAGQAAPAPDHASQANAPPVLQPDNLPAVHDLSVAAAPVRQLEPKDSPGHCPRPHNHAASKLRAAPQSVAAKHKCDQGDHGAEQRSEQDAVVADQHCDQEASVASNSGTPRDNSWRCGFAHRWRSARRVDPYEADDAGLDPVAFLLAHGAAAAARMAEDEWGDKSGASADSLRRVLVSCMQDATGSASFSDGGLTGIVSSGGEMHKELALAAKSAQAVLATHDQLLSNMAVTWSNSPERCDLKWVGPYITPVQVDPAGQFEFILAKLVDNINGRSKFVVRGRQRAGAEQLLAELKSEVAAAAARHKLPNITNVDFLGKGFLQFAAGRRINVSWSADCGSAAPGAAGARRCGRAGDPSWPQMRNISVALLANSLAYDYKLSCY